MIKNATKIFYSSVYIRDIGYYRMYLLGQLIEVMLIIVGMLILVVMSTTTTLTTLIGSRPIV